MSYGHVFFGQCIYCEHYMGADQRNELVCTAFPNGIPESIVDGTVDHRTPFADEKFLFKVLPEKEEEFSVWVSVHLAKQERGPISPTEKSNSPKRPVYRAK